MTARAPKLLLDALDAAQTAREDLGPLVDELTRLLARLQANP